MPRKLRNPKTRQGPAPEVSRGLFLLLLWGDWNTACAQKDADDESKWEFFDKGGHANAWHAIEAQALDKWTAVYPGSRPESWWKWSAPELRRIHGRFTVRDGAGRCQASGVPYGEPDDWNDLPMVESTPAYLARLRLWLPGERARVAAEAFASQPFSWDLTVSPHGVPDDESDLGSNHYDD